MNTLFTRPNPTMHNILKVAVHLVWAHGGGGVVIGIADTMRMGVGSESISIYVYICRVMTFLKTFSPERFFSSLVFADVILQIRLLIITKIF